jgi:hypothetical protein
MADEPTEITNKPSPAEERITQLSEKVRLTSEERDEKARLLNEVTKERDFYSGFSDVVTTNPAAKDHKEDILAKVKSGYTVEDATYAVLGKAGKLGQTAPAPAEPMNPAGGSAVVNTSTNSGEKPIGEMSLAEKREAIEKMYVIT